MRRSEKPHTSTLSCNESAPRFGPDQATTLADAPMRAIAMTERADRTIAFATRHMYGGAVSAPCRCAAPVASRLSVAIGNGHAVARSDVMRVRHDAQPNGDTRFACFGADFFAALMRVNRRAARRAGVAGRSVQRTASSGARGYRMENAATAEPASASRSSCGVVREGDARICA
jgi:hypothetical protein